MKISAVFLIVLFTFAVQSSAQRRTTDAEVVPGEIVYDELDNAQSDDLGMMNQDQINNMARFVQGMMG